MGIRLVNHHRKRSAIMPDLKKYQGNRIKF